MYIHYTDPTRIAAVQHYSFLVDSLLDTEDQISDGTHTHTHTHTEFKL